jgi:hypothetical protein
MVSRNGKLMIAAALSAFLITACSKDKKSRHDGNGAYGDTVQFIGIWGPKLTHDLYVDFSEANRGDGHDMSRFCQKYAKNGRRESRRTGMGIVLKGLLIQHSGKLYNYRGIDRVESKVFQSENYLGQVDNSGYVKYQPYGWGRDDGYLGQRGRRDRYSPQGFRGHAHVTEPMSYMSISSRELIVQFSDSGWGQSPGYHRVYVEVSEPELRGYLAMKLACEALNGNRGHKRRHQVRDDEFEFDPREADFEDVWEESEVVTEKSQRSARASALEDDALLSVDELPPSAPQD